LNEQATADFILFGLAIYLSSWLFVIKSALYKKELFKFFKLPKKVMYPEFMRELDAVNDEREFTLVVQ
jgi:hypothetical protein